MDSCTPRVITVSTIVVSVNIADAAVMRIVCTAVGEPSTLFERWS